MRRQTDNPRPVGVRWRTDGGWYAGPLMPALRLDEIGAVRRSRWEREAREPLFGWNEVHVRHVGYRHRGRGISDLGS